jgi:hypothetical protein
MGGEFMSATYLRAIARSRIALVLVVGFSASIATVGQPDSSIQAKLHKQPLELAIKADPVVPRGSPVEMTIRITNTSTSEMHASAMHLHGGFAISYTYDIRDQSGNKLGHQPFGDEELSASGPIFTLQPGQSRSELTIISAYYDLGPGKYTIQISKPVSNAPGAEVVKSNKIIVIVTP